MNLKKLLDPRSIALVGASEKEGKVGNAIAKNLTNLGYSGEVFFVNPNHSEILGRKSYKNIKEIESEIDLAIIAVPAPLVLEVIKNGAEKTHSVKSSLCEGAKGVFNGVKNFVVISAGFSESGEEGKKREEELKKLAENKGLNILGPNCLGFVNPLVKLNASFAGGMPEAGNISFVTQSGALAVAFLDMAKKEKMKFSKIVSTGNEMQITETDVLKFLKDDKQTEVIGMYSEGIKEGRKFIKYAQEISASKPVIILKAGRNEKTQKAIAFHTGALTGDDAVISAAIKKAGAIRVDNLEEFFNLLNLAGSTENITGKKTVIITNAGGLGILLADALNNKNIRLSKLDEKIKKELRECLPLESSVENPIDLLGDAKEDRYKKALEIISKDEETRIIICALTPQDQTPVEKIADEIISFKKSSNKFVATVFLGGEKVKIANNKFRENEIISFIFPDSAVEAIDDLYKWSSFSRDIKKEKNPIINEKRTGQIVKIIKTVQTEKRQVLHYQEAANILERYGIEALPAVEIKSNEIYFPKLSYPAVLKIDDEKVLHKTDKGALILGIKNENELNKAVSNLRLNFHKSRLIAQPMAEKGTEIIIGLKRDNNFGPVIICGLGGIYTEVFKMADYLMPPMDRTEIKNSLLDGKLNFLFKKTREQKEYNVEELAGIISGLCQMALEIPGICELDINPLIMYNNGRKAAIVDVKILI